MWDGGGRLPRATLDAKFATLPPARRRALHDALAVVAPAVPTAWYDLPAISATLAADAASLVDLRAAIADRAAGALGQACATQ